MRTFEDLLDGARNLDAPPTERQRSIYWCDDSRQLAIALSRGGSLELFITGDALKPRIPLVGRHLEYNEWRVANGDQFTANRLIFPTDSHFVAVAAFIAEELLRCGVIESPAQAFAKCEPVIEMALRRAALAEESILGLLGELYLLRTLLTSAGDASQRAHCVRAWRGHEQSSRDFVFPNAHEVEVKVTRGEHSRHRISRIDQVDPRRDASGAPSEQLILLSVQLTHAQPSDDPATHLTVPSMCESLLLLLGSGTEPATRNEIQELFLMNLANYGPDAGRGYVHDTMRDWSAYQTPWTTGFIRIYSMNDPAVDLLRSKEAASHAHLDPNSVCYTIDLPELIGDGNPTCDVEALATVLLE